MVEVFRWQSLINIRNLRNTKSYFPRKFIQWITFLLRSQKSDEDSMMLQNQLMSRLKNTLSTPKWPRNNRKLRINWLKKLFWDTQKLQLKSALMRWKNGFKRWWGANRKRQRNSCIRWKRKENLKKVLRTQKIGPKLAARKVIARKNQDLKIDQSMSKLSRDLILEKLKVLSVIIKDLKSHLQRDAKVHL